MLFIRDSIDRCHDVAVGAGAPIVHCCGFDSIPSDLGVLLLHHAACADDAGDLQDTTLVVTTLKGGVSGGTLASMMGQQDEVRASAERRQVVQDPYALSPDRPAEPDLGGERDLDWFRYDGDLRMWLGPFVMAGINTRVVRRSNALQGWAYGRRFRYREVTGFGVGPAAPMLGTAVSAALKTVQAGLTFGPSRALLGQLLPAPGQGPDEKTRRTGLFRIQSTRAPRPECGTWAPSKPAATQATPPRHHAGKRPAPRRPGTNSHRADPPTPATAMGIALADRLRSAGHTLATQQVTGYPLPGRYTSSGSSARRLRTPGAYKYGGADLEVNGAS